jgi:hypothetical protein
MSPVLLFLLAAQGGSPWQGSLTLGGKVHPLQFACAYEREDPFDDKKKRIEVVLSAGPVAGAAAKSCKEITGDVAELAEKDRLPRMVASLLLPGFVWDRATLYAGERTYSYSFFDSDVTSKFDPSDTGKLSGRMATNSEQKVGDWPPMKLDVTLAVPYTKVVPKSPAITGADAQRHPATVAARKFLTALAAGNPAQARASLVEAERARFDEMVKSQGADAMKAMASDALKLPDTTVALRGAAAAEVVFERRSANGSGRERARFQLRQEQGEWRVTQGR